MRRLLLTMLVAALCAQSAGRRVRHFFSASESEFCTKALEYGYEGC